MKHSFQEYNVDLSKIEEWLPWGGLIHPAIVRNKDDSLMGFFQYTSKENPEPVNFNLTFGNGWSLWSEKQHLLDATLPLDQFYITLVWNPFFNNQGQIFNTLDNTKTDREGRISYFFEILRKIETLFKGYVDLHILTNDSVLAYLRSSLSLSARPIPQLAEPLYLYLDALLSQDLDFTVRKNDLEIDGKAIGIITPLWYPDPSVVQALFAQLERIPYRFVRRFLFCDELTFKKEQNRYMAKWCPGRSSMLNFIKDQIQGQICGYDTSSFLFFHEDQSALQRILENAEAAMEQLEIPSIIEDFNKKDVFWGNLPGLFRANLVPPITKAEEFKDFFLCGLPKEKKEEDV